MLLMFILTNFSPPTKLFLLVPNAEDSVFFLLSGDQIYFDFLSIIDHQNKKELEKLKNSHFGQIQIQFVVCKLSY